MLAESKISNNLLPGGYNDKGNFIRICYYAVRP